MNSESQACTIFVNSLKLKGEQGYKIPDPTGDFANTIKRPFDIIGSWQNKALYVECKYLSSLKSFDLKRIEDHQIEYLLNFKNNINNAESWIVLAIKVGRGDNRFYIFKNIEEIQKRRLEKKNFLKKELETLPYLKVKKDLIDIN